jgi:hypothetical protein
MKSDTQPNSKQFWKEHVNQWNDTSLSQASYCQTHQLSIKRFGYWKRKQLGPTPLTKPAKKTNSFIQVSPNQYSPTQTPTLAVVLPNQMRIEGITTDNLALVKNLAGQLK